MINRIVINFNKGTINQKACEIIHSKSLDFCTFDPMFATRKIILILIILFGFRANAQFFDIGQDPASVKWNIIKTSHFKVIYPVDIEPQAQHVANMLEQVYQPLSASMKINPVNIPVVLHNRSITSNAMVPWAPKRIEFFTNPSQDDYPQPWLDQLALHEFRHVVQYSKINTGFTKALSYVFGQQITAGVIGTFVPMWFVEGDAVCTEVAFSESGRGRMPAFEMELRSQVMEKGFYRYDKAVFGSYRTYTPNRYILGYHIVATAQKQYTYDVWESAMQRTAHLPFMVVPFTSGIKKVSGLWKSDLYKQCMRGLDSLWTIQDANIRKTDYTLLSTKPNKLFCSYNHGNFVDDSVFVAVKSGINDIDRFIIIDNLGKEKKLFTPGAFNPTALSFAGSKLVWAETAYDLRWENRSYSVIKTYDFATGKVKQLTHRTRYFAPSINKQGDEIVCMEQAVDGKSSVVILDAFTGAIINRIAADSGDYIMTPAWSEDSKEVVFIALNRFGKRICLWNGKDEIKDLTSPSFVNIQQPKKMDSLVFYVGVWSGINNVYCLDISSGKTFQVTSSRFGATDLSFSDDGTLIIYSDYTSDGYKLVKAAIESQKWVPLVDVNDNSIKLYESLTQNNKPIDFYQQQPVKYPQKHYSKLLNLFNIHSWGPLSINADNTTIKPGVEVVSQNLLSTMVMSAGYEHEWNDFAQQFYTNFSYKGLYPQFDLQLSYQLQKQDTIRYDIFTTQFNVSIPFNLSRGKYYRSVQPLVGYIFSQYIPGKNHPEVSGPLFYHSLQYRLFMYNMLKTSERDFLPRWGQMAEINFRNSPFTGIDPGNIVAVETKFYFPGIGKHHSYNMYLAYQKRHSTSNSSYNDIIEFPKGIYNIDGQQEYWVGKFNYEMPLFYPDWSLGPVVYIKRFRAGAHYEHALVTDWSNISENYNSIGYSVLADFHFLRFLAPISLGCRVTHPLHNTTDDYRPQIELLYSINFDQLYFKPRFSRTSF